MLLGNRYLQTLNKQSSWRTGHITFLFPSLSDSSRTWTAPSVSHKSFQHIYFL